MLKRVILGVVAATFVGTALANGYVFDDPYWKQALSKNSPPQYAAAGTTVRDVAAVDESSGRESGVQIVEGNKARRQALERAGFPQYAG